MTGKIKVLLPLLLIFLLVGCGKTDDGLTIEGHDWTYANAIDSAGQPLDLSVLTCAAQDGSLTVTDSDGSTQSGTYTLTQHDANDVLYDLTLDSETGTALVGVTEYTDAAGGKSSEYTLILSLPERTVYFRRRAGSRSCRYDPPDTLWQGWLDSNQRVRESKSLALPLGYTPV